MDGGWWAGSLEERLKKKGKSSQWGKKIIVMWAICPTHNYSVYLIKTLVDGTLVMSLTWNVCFIIVQ